MSCPSPEPKRHRPNQQGGLLVGFKGVVRLREPSALRHDITPRPPPLGGGIDGWTALCCVASRDGSHTRSWRIHLPQPQTQHDPHAWPYQMERHHQWASVMETTQQQSLPCGRPRSKARTLGFPASWSAPLQHLFFCGEEIREIIGSARCPAP